ncbi:hypothetical protein ACFYMW_11740 [Streptomyces sp. NPDC006692]|uniref:hypothetical protein n=1 Tax=Streptomyces sp. NPDC006692 TaxID=3364758 RepID=UPI0036C2F61D
MADNEKKPTDAERVDLQMAVRDMATSSSKAVSGLPLGGAPTGRTDFEGHHLNDMIDLVHNANPGHLISTGEALWAARNAIRKAAEELSGHIDYVDWEGESGNAFRTWGQNLVSKSHQLADFADAAGVQISVAGAGLASVSKAMPPRDERSELVKAMDIPLSKRVSGNASFDAAMRVEADRQEAINQMNRLSSFYAIAEQNLAAQTPPVFEPMPEVGVPAPERRPITDPPSHSAIGVPRYRPGGPAATSPDVLEAPITGRQRLDDTVSARHTGSADASPLPVVDRPLGTELNTLTLAPPASPSHAGAFPVTPITSTSPGATSVPPSMVGPANPVAARGFGAVRGHRMPTQTPIVTSGPSREGTSPSGRARAAAQALGDELPTVSQSPVGSGVAGGTPYGDGTAPSRAGSGATPRGNGIIGGQPNVGTPAVSGPRMPRGAVVGGEGGAGAAKSATLLGQRGVVGNPNVSSVGKERVGRPTIGNADGVVGTPASRSAGAHGSRKGFTRGGSGLVRAAEKQSDGESQLETHQGSDRLVEGSAPMAQERQNHVPPATN